MLPPQTSIRLIKFVLGMISVFINITPKFRIISKNLTELKPSLCFLRAVGLSAVMGLFLRIIYPLYLDTREPGNRSFLGVDPDSLSPQTPVLAGHSPWLESSLLNLHMRVSRSSRDPRETIPHRLGSAPRNNSTSRAHSHYVGQKEGELSASFIRVL